MKYNELVDFAKKYLEEKGVFDYHSDTFLLLEYVFGISKTEYFLKMSEDIQDTDKIDIYIGCLEVRANGKPLQYITGTQDFMGFSFKVSEAVLIPRYDTEILVENVLNTLKEYTVNGDDVRVCDMCTGSGCIGISIAKLGNIKDVTCVDISKEALEIARENADLNNVSNIKFVHSNLFTEISADKKFDFIVSNPPYIKTMDIEDLMDEVRLHEPRLALDGDSDGLKFYNKITREAVLYLKNGGWLMYEIGYDQGEEVNNIMKENGFADVKVIKDLAGLDRVVIGRKISEA